MPIVVLGDKGCDPMSKRVTVKFDGEIIDYRTTPYLLAQLDAQQAKYQETMAQAIGEFCQRNELPSLAAAIERYRTAQTVLTMALYELMQRR